MNLAAHDPHWPVLFHVVTATAYAFDALLGRAVPRQVRYWAADRSEAVAVMERWRQRPGMSGVQMDQECVPTEPQALQAWLNERCANDDELPVALEQVAL